MKLYAPEYYKKFKCIADKCTHSCCTGWEISLDCQTFSLCDKLPESDREEILSHVEDGCIKLTEEGRCPFLDERGLCRIISKYGEEYTSVICREHPRFYNFYSDRAEVGIGASCEEAAKIILESDTYDRVLPIGECADDGRCDFDATPERDFIFYILKKSGLTFSERIDKIKKKYYLEKELFEPKALIEKLSCLEYLREEDKKLICQIISSKNKENHRYCERFFAYLVYRHFGEATSFENMRARLCLCILLVTVFESLLSMGLDTVTVARTVSEEIEYSEDNIDSIIFDFECEL